MDREDRRLLLLVEDEAVLAMREKIEFEGYGYDVVLALSGEEAVAAIESEPGIDLVLMDIDLGEGMDGTEAATRIHKIREVPVVFLSSHSERDMVMKTERITSYGYVVKNSGMVVIDASIKMALKLFSANRELAESEHRLERAEGIAHIGNWKIFLDSGHIVGSRGASQIYGLEEGELNLREVQAMVLPEYREQGDRAMEGLLARGEPYDLVAKIRRKKDGSIIDVRSIGSHDRAARVVYGVVQDVSAQVRAGEAAAKEVLDGLESRVRCVESLCDGLFAAGSNRFVSAGDYLPRLTKGALSERPYLGSACLDETIEDFGLDPRRMLLLGLALNEMLNIAMGREEGAATSGSIRVEVSCRDGRITTVVESEQAAMVPAGEGGAFLAALLPRLGATFRREAGLRRLVFGCAV